MPTSRSTPNLSTRRCLTIHRTGEADVDTVAELLRAAAEQLDRLDAMSVHHLELDTVDDARRSEITLTVYLEAEARRA